MTLCQCSCGCTHHLVAGEKCVRCLNEKHMNWKKFSATKVEIRKTVPR